MSPAVKELLPVPPCNKFITLAPKLTGSFTFVSSVADNRKTDRLINMAAEILKSNLLVIRRVK